MVKKIRTTGFLLLLIVSQFSFGQTNKDKALEIGNQAVKLEDQGDYKDAIKLFEEAHKLDPDKIDYPYEIAYSYMQLKEYKTAINIVEKLTEHKDVEDVIYELLGNAYDYLGKPEKAISTYESGLKKFPNSGRLYLELGVMQKAKKDYDKAVNYFEKGIMVAPKFSSNYYWAAKLYCGSTEEVWGMIYGELFMNLERRSERTSEISKLLYDTYKSEIKFTNDSSMSVSFCKQMTINAVNISGSKDITLPFCMIYEPTLALAIIPEKSININSLDRIRGRFLATYFDKGFDKTHPNILFDYQDKISKSGHLEAYNHWILMKGDEDSFDTWHSVNQQKWDDFVKWFTDNGIVVDDAHKFYKGQY